MSDTVDRDLRQCGDTVPDLGSEKIVIDAEAIAEVRRGLGRELAVYRRAAGYNQTQFAPFTGYSRSTLANVETGRQIAPRWFWERCDEKLATGGVLAARCGEIEALKAKRQQAAAQALQAERERQLRQVHGRRVPGPRADQGPGDNVAGSGWAPDLAAVRQTTVDLWSDEFDESSLTADDTTASSSAALRWLVALDDTATAHETGWRRVGLSDVERIRGVRRQLKAMDNAHGGGAAFPMAVVYLRREVAPLLSGRYDDVVGQALSARSPN